jgi:hypothetical protein
VSGLLGGFPCAFKGCRPLVVPHVATPQGFNDRRSGWNARTLISTSSVKETTLSRRSEYTCATIS